jgi:hypothetical protein
MAGGNSPTVKTLLMIEKAILDSEIYPTRMELYRSLPRRIHYSTFKNALEYLEASGKIGFNSKKIVYTGVNNEKLRKLIAEGARIR